MERKAILVTGASSGIGLLLTEHLARMGHVVYAGARAPDRLERIASLRNVRPLLLDLTDSKSVAAAVEEVAKSDIGLYGLVNNAGVATFGSVLDGDADEFDLVMAVNVRGTYLATRAFAPLIIPHRGRVVTIGSISGILAEPKLSAYSMSKHALEAFVDAFAHEVEALGVGASIVEPGGFRTRLSENIKDRLGALPGLPDLSARREPHDVVLAVTSALFDASTRRRYLVVATAEEARRTLCKQIEQLVQLNQGHTFTLDRDQLVHLLDATLAANRATPAHQAAVEGAHLSV